MTSEATRGSSGMKRLVRGPANDVGTQSSNTRIRLVSTSAVLEARDVIDTVGNVARRADQLAGEFADAGSKLARTTSMVVDEVVNPVTRVAAVARGVRVGAMTLLDTILKRRSLGSAAHTGGNHHE